MDWRTEEGWTGEEARFASEEVLLMEVETGQTEVEVMEVAALLQGAA